jgi:hypothetical protein
MKLEARGRDGGAAAVTTAGPEAGGGPAGSEGGEGSTRAA